MALATGTTKNTCEQAFDLLATHQDCTFRAATGTLEFSRKVAPSGMASAGYRTITVRPCDRIRWLVVEFGWKTIAEVDQRNFHDQPEAMAIHVAVIIDKAFNDCAARYTTQPSVVCVQAPQKTPASATTGFREELTPAGLQLVIPGCDRVPVADKHGAAQLSLF